VTVTELPISFRLFRMSGKRNGRSQRKTIPLPVIYPTVSTIRATTLMMETESTSETSVKFYPTTRRNIPEDSHLHSRRRENLSLTKINFFPISNHHIVKAYRLRGKILNSVCSILGERFHSIETLSQCGCDSEEKSP
jgi:hypothetical protein